MTTAAMAPLDLLAATGPTIGAVGSSFYFVPDTLARGEELGLDASQFYVLGRGGVLGDVEPVVIQAAFGYFNPKLVAKVWNGARQKLAPRDAAHEYAACCANWGRQQLSDVDGLEAFCAAAEQVNDAADPDGLALYAGLTSEPLADDLPARAQQLITVLRELRGSAHLVAIRASGLTSKDAHFVKRPNDIAMFGWSADDAPVIDDALIAKHTAAERLTDEIVLPAYATLDADQQQAFVHGLEGIAAALAS